MKNQCDATKKKRVCDPKLYENFITVAV